MPCRLSERGARRSRHGLSQRRRCYIAGSWRLARTHRAACRRPRTVGAVTRGRFTRWWPSARGPAGRHPTAASSGAHPDRAAGPPGPCASHRRAGRRRTAWPSSLTNCSCRRRQIVRW